MSFIMNRKNQLMLPTNGIVILGATGTVVQGNLIGTQVDGIRPLGNSSAGIEVFFGSNSIIGGTSSGASNTIAFNGHGGVAVFSRTGNAIRSNSIFLNSGLGIDLTILSLPDGMTLNDPGDADTGANNLQNFPVLTSATSGGGSTTIQGTLNSTANTAFSLDFFSNTLCDPSGFGE